MCSCAVVPSDRRPSIAHPLWPQGLLNAYGYYIVEDAERDAADVWCVASLHAFRIGAHALQGYTDRLVNSCTVKDPSQAAFVNLVQQGRARGKSVVVAGCVPQGMCGRRSSPPAHSRWPCR